MWVPKRYPKYLEAWGFSLLGGSNGYEEYFFCYGYFSMKDGSEIRFWEDKWLGNATLREQYPALYSIVRHKGDTIATVMESFSPNVTFRRDLIGPRLQSWNILLQRLFTVQLSHRSDVFRWNLHGNGQFSVESMYRALLQSDVPVIIRRSGR